MTLREGVVDYGFSGNDVVRGFSLLCADVVAGTQLRPEAYPGLVYRDGDGRPRRNPEFPGEYRDLPLPDYSFINSFDPFQKHRYIARQQTAYRYMKEDNLRGVTIDLARGCPKFARRRDSPSSAGHECSFCAIDPGEAPVQSATPKGAWALVKNAVDADFNYLYLTADELPVLFAPLITAMAESKPAWFTRLERRGGTPRFFGYARADSFSRCGTTTRAALSSLGFDHYFVGFDFFDPLSLQVSHKAYRLRPGNAERLARHNFEACEVMLNSGAKFTAGIVINHLGMTRSLLESNLRLLSGLLDAHSDMFLALDFGALCPLPGSQDYQYLIYPQLAQRTAEQYGLRVNQACLNDLAEKYQCRDDPDVTELIRDYVAGCCPEISMDDVDEVIYRLTKLCVDRGLILGGQCSALA